MSKQLYHQILMQPKLSEKLLLALYIMSTLCLSAFLVAILLSLQYPSDDGACKLYDNIDSWLSTKSIFDSNENKCEWIQDSNNIYRISNIFKH